MSDHEAVRQLLARFIQLRDDKRFAEWVELFEPDGVFTYVTRVLVGRDAIRSDVEALLRHDRGKHLCTNSVIDLNGDVGSAVSDFVKLRQVEDAGGPARLEVQVMGRYYDVLARHGAGWLIRRRDVILFGDPLPSPGLAPASTEEVDRGR